MNIVLCTISSISRIYLRVLVKNKSLKFLFLTQDLLVI